MEEKIVESPRAMDSAVPKPEQYFRERNRSLRQRVIDAVDAMTIATAERRERAEFARRSRGMDRAQAGQEITAVVLTVEPSRFYEQCLLGLERQSVRPASVEVVRNVSPFSKASQEGLDRVRTPYYVSVDEDMMLAPDAVERLYLALTAGERVGEVAMRLKDPILGAIYGVHAYRTAPAREIGFHPLRDEKGSERRMAAELRANGWEVRALKSVAGVHHPDYTPEEVYWKFRFAGEKVRFYGGERGESERRQTLGRLERFWRTTRSDLVYFAIAGFEEGLQAEDATGELDYRRRKEAPTLRAVREWVRERSRMNERTPSE